jgi:hypothetical protein
MTTPREPPMATDRPPLTPETYRTVQAIFFAARERAPQERASFLDSACGTDTVVRAEVDSLLAADERNVDFLEKSALADMDARRSDLRAQLSGALGSRYEILNEIGGGGMSRLFLAQEHAPDRLVVIKVLSRELGAELSTQRFAREIQVAARMQHPNIVPLFVTGEVDGLPYFTMPYVEGKLRDLCAASELVPAQQALRILRDIAKALAFAH